MDVIGWFMRACKRLLVFLLGVGVIASANRLILPYFERRTPLLIAVGLTYGVVAYGLIPLAIRAWRLLFPSNHIPLHTVTPDGFAGDPVNIGMVGTRRQVVTVFAAAGWHTADPITFRSTLRLIQAVVLNRAYPTAPFSGMFLFGRKQDLSFQKAVGDSARKRHHVRFWQVIQPEGEHFRDHVKFWLKHYGTVQPGKSLWVGAATEDVGVTLLRHNAKFTHGVHPDTNAERDFIVRELQATKHTKTTRILKAAEPYQLRNLSGTTLITDGTIKILEL